MQSVKTYRATGTLVARTPSVSGKTVAVSVIVHAYTVEEVLASAYRLMVCEGYNVLLQSIEEITDATAG